MNALLLEGIAARLRLEILDLVYTSQKGHIGGALSVLEILISLFYTGIMKFDPARPHWEGRDFFILSKGHAVVGLFPILADLGFFSRDILTTFGENGSYLGGHPDRRVPGIEIDSGSLGHGLSIATGLALSFSMNHACNRVFVVLGDGECHEGSVWEAVLLAAQHRLHNLIVLIDRNQQCVLDFTEYCVALDPLEEKFSAFGWETAVVDGHSLSSLVGSLRNCFDTQGYKPQVIIAQTIKGKGVSFMERNIAWHHGIPTEKEYAAAKRELSIALEVASKSP